MNPRIQELAEQVVGPSRLFGGEFALMGDSQVEKFALLIIRECAIIADEGLAWALEGDEIADSIIEHFGVK